MTNTPTTEAIERVKQLDAAATAGPWKAFPQGIVDMQSDSYSTIDVNGYRDKIDFDANFIAYARTALPQFAQALQYTIALVTALRNDHFLPEIDRIMAGKGVEGNDIIEDVEWAELSDIIHDSEAKLARAIELIGRMRHAVNGLGQSLCEIGCCNVCKALKELKGETND